MHSFFYFVAQWRSVDFWCSLQKFIYTVDALYLLNWNIKVGSRRTPSSLSVAPLSMEMSSGSLLICVFSPFDSNTSGICLSSCCTWSTPYRTSSFALLLLLHSLYLCFISICPISCTFVGILMGKRDFIGFSMSSFKNFSDC